MQKDCFQSKMPPSGRVPKGEPLLGPISEGTAQGASQGKKRLEWDYSRMQLTHRAGPWGDEGAVQGYDRKWKIRDCRPYRSIHLPEHGYDLFLWDKVIAHEGTVKKLKLRAQELEDAG